MWTQLFLTPSEGVAVALSTAGIYWVFVVLVRLLGQRALARMSSADLATVVGLGAVIGRAALGYTPTFGAGVIALITLFVMQAIAGQIRRWTSTSRVLNNRPVLIMAGDHVLQQNLRRTHLAEEELWPALRLAGIRNRTEVACVILEPTGELSVLRRGAMLDRELMVDVRGLEYLSPQFSTAPSGPSGAGSHRAVGEDPGRPGKPGVSDPRQADGRDRSAGDQGKDGTEP